MRIIVNLNKALIKNVTKECARKGIWSALDHLAAKSKEQVPLDKGPLKASCAVSVADDGSQGVVSYDTPYAVKQHETLYYKHSDGRKAKYLEDPVNDTGIQTEMRDLLAKAFEGAM